MPRIRIKQPEALLHSAGARANERDLHIDELYAEAIDVYIETTKNASPGSLRSRGTIPVSSPQIIVEIPEELFQRAEKVAKRLGKRRDVMYAEALARHVQYDPGGDSALNQGHDLPSGAWRSKTDA